MPSRDALWLSNDFFCCAALKVAGCEILIHVLIITLISLITAGRAVYDRLPAHFYD